MESLLPHVLAAAARDVALAAVPAEATRLLDRAAAYLVTRGEYQAALAPYERAYHMRRDTFGDDHPDTLTSASRFAADLRMLGEHQQARQLQTDALTRRRVLGDNHPDTLTLRAGSRPICASWRVSAAPRPRRGHPGPAPPGAG
jgi:hypothetical protein